MAFVQNNLNLMSTLSASDAPAMYCYNSTTDALAAIVTSGYFNNINTLLKSGDIVVVNATDANAIRFVTVTSGVVTLAAGS